MHVTTKEKRAVQASQQTRNGNLFEINEKDKNL